MKTISTNSIGTRLIDKYKPTEDTILLPRKTAARKILKELLNSGQFPYYGVLLHSDTGGTGKTQFINLLKSLFNYYKVFEIDSAGEGLAKIKQLSDDLHDPLGHLTTSYRLVIGNEISVTGKQAREALRGVIDKYNHNTFFIFTDNNLPKLKLENPQLFDSNRVLAIDYEDLDQAEFIEYFETILKNENIELTDKVTKIIARNFPSIRKTLQTLDAAIQGGLIK